MSIYLVLPSPQSYSRSISKR